MLLLSGSRASFRLVGEFVERRRVVGQRCVIYGTGGAALSTIRAAFGASTALRILGFVDDDPQQHNMRVQGYPVVGDYRALVSMVDAGEIDCVVLNAPVLDAERLEQLESACRVRQVSLLKLQINLKPLTPATS
jgi:FlaA1/EpsC-like NDP-sugar epimerase